MIDEGIQSHGAKFYRYTLGVIDGGPICKCLESAAAQKRDERISLC